MPLDKLVVIKLGEVFTGAATKSRLKLCAQLRISFEGWLKIELLHALSENQNLELYPEWDHIDVVVGRRDASEYCLVELKTFPTNYGSAGKPITQFIWSVNEDIAKLREKAESGEIGLVAWVAYPVPRKNEHGWKTLLQRVNDLAGQPLCCEEIDLGSEGFAHLYVHQATPAS